MVRNQEEFLEVKMKYIEEEIDIRVESLKNEVDECGLQLKERLRELKLEANKYRTVIVIVVEYLGVRLKEHILKQHTQNSRRVRVRLISHSNSTCAILTCAILNLLILLNFLCYYKLAVLIVLF